MKCHASTILIPHFVYGQAPKPTSHAKARSKPTLKRTLIASALALAFAPLAYSAPLGGQVTSGSGSISQSGAITTIAQASQNLSLNWNSFNIGSSETVNFVQPSSSAIAVNRIIDTNGTQILGNLNANGRVFLINPNGILFGSGAQVNVGGLIASTLDFNDVALNSNSLSLSGTGTGSVINQGTINAANAGYVALIGNTVSNQGTITAPQGTVALGAGSATTLTFAGNGLVHLQVDQSTLNSLAENGGLIQTEGGQVLMTAGAKDALLASVVNNTGVIEARTVSNQSGTIVLLGGMAAGTVNVGGTLDASAPNGGNGGLIETSATKVIAANGTQVTTVAASGLSGTWMINPVNFTIAASGGDITGATLSNSLSTGNVTIPGSNIVSGREGDVNINDVVTWSANLLTIKSQHNININANLNGSGTASLALEYGQGALASGNASDYFLNNGAQVNLPAGQNFSTRLGSDGIVKNFTVITSLGAAGSTTTVDLQGINGGLAGNYVLGSDIEASSTSTWNSNAGFTPIGNDTTPFTGIFDGLGHTISNININLPTASYVGLFGYIGTGSTISNVGLVGSVTGSNYVGGLGGGNSGTISNSYVTGSVSGTNIMGTFVGGLVGSSSGAISNSYATGSVSGTYNGSTNAGTYSGIIISGGLVGSSSGTINNSYLNGTLTVNPAVLILTSNGTITITGTLTATVGTSLSGGASLSSGIIAGTSGTFTIASGMTLNNGTFTGSSGTLSLAGGATIQPTSTLSGNTPVTSNVNLNVAPTNATATTPNPATAPKTVLNAIAQLESNVPSSHVDVQPQALSLPPSITVTQSASSGAVAGSNAPTIVSGLLGGILTNTGNHGISLQIVDGGMKLPEVTVSANE